MGAILFPLNVLFTHLVAWVAFVSLLAVIANAVRDESENLLTLQSDPPVKVQVKIAVDGQRTNSSVNSTVGRDTLGQRTNPDVDVTAVDSGAVELGRQKVSTIPMTKLGEYLKTYTAEGGLEESYRQEMIKLFETAGPSEAFKKSHKGGPGIEKEGHFTNSPYIVCGDSSSAFFQHVFLVHKFGMWIQPGGHFQDDDTDVIAAGERNAVPSTKFVDKPFFPKEQLTPLTPEGFSSPLFDLDVHYLKTEETHHFDLRVLLSVSPCSINTYDEEAINEMDPTWMLFDKAHEAAPGESVQRALRKLHTFGLLQ